MYYSEPIKNKHLWIVERFSNDNQKLETYEFGSENGAWKFLKTINIYISGNIVYSGI